MILSGSRAIKHWYPDFNRQPKDTDYIVQEKFNKPSKLDKGIEYLINPVFKDYRGNILLPNDLCTLKASHLCWDIQWDKHMFDLQFLLKKGCKIDTGLFWRLYDYWNTLHGQNKRSDLKMSKEDFFTNAVNYDTLSHDETHKLLNPVPVYTKVLKDGCEVELDPQKFIELTHEEKLDFVREEVMVMASERYQKLGFKRAYNRMLKKFIISHVPKFALLFTLENYVVLQRCNIDFLEIINNKKECTV